MIKAGAGTKITDKHYNRVIKHHISLKNTMLEGKLKAVDTQIFKGLLSNDTISYNKK